jgi:glutamate-1-semialdehyde 2,1-aminomutase
MAYIQERSKDLHQRALRCIPRGTHSDSRARTPHPTYFLGGEGAWVTDVDGNRHLDCVLGNGAVILGHAHPAVDRAVIKQLKAGLGAGLETELSVGVAEQFLASIPVERVRFTNTGTEAMTHAISMARARTGKNDVAKAEGSYHGWSDFLFVSVFHDLRNAGNSEAPASVAGSTGLHSAAVSSTLVLPFNNIEATENLVRANAHRLAAVVLEPIMIDIGWVPARREYLQKLRDLTTELGIVLIFDELLTGFRLPQGSAQQFYGIQPDLSIFGKAIANGYPMAAVAGRASLMAPELPEAPRAAFVGTFNGHQMALSASACVLELLADGAIQRQLQDGTRFLVEKFDETARRVGVPARMVGGGGHFHWYFTDAEVTDYRSAIASDANACQAFAGALQERGVLCSSSPLQHHAISTAHGEAELRFLSAAMDTGLEAAARAKTCSVAI